MEKLLVTSNFSYSHSVFKRLVLKTSKNRGLFVKGLKQLQMTVSLWFKWCRFSLRGRKHWGERRKCWKSVHFPQCFQLLFSTGLSSYRCVIKDSMCISYWGSRLNQCYKVRSDFVKKKHRMTNYLTTAPIFNFLPHSEIDDLSRLTTLPN